MARPLKVPLVYASKEAMENDGSRWQVLIGEDRLPGDNVIYLSANKRGGGYFTIDITDDLGTIDLVIEVDGGELAALTQMFASAAAESRYKT